MKKCIRLAASSLFWVLVPVLVTYLMSNDPDMLYAGSLVTDPQYEPFLLFGSFSILCFFCLGLSIHSLFNFVISLIRLWRNNRHSDSPEDPG